MLKAKCPNCGHQGRWREGVKWWKLNATWPCKKCGVLLKVDIERLLWVGASNACFCASFLIWVKHWNLLVYCLLPVGILILLSFKHALKRVKIVQSSNENSDVDSPQKAPFNEERRQIIWLKAKCPNCGYKRPWDRDKWWTWKPKPTWPCKQCGIMLEMDHRRGFLVLLVYSAFWLIFQLWVMYWSFLVYCFLPVGIWIILSLKRVKIVESSNEDSAVDSPQKAPLTTKGDK